MNLLTILRSPSAREREALVAGSLASSNTLRARLLSSSVNADAKSRLYAMSFHKEWRHPECKVMEWYRLHTVTQFTSIQHWKSLDNSFYHEFLVIQLSDGSACRVERMGDGSRAGALQTVGCTAYDLIQWFSPSDNLAKEWSKGLNEMLIQVEFPCAFDLLDVLAVCHTIQHRNRRGSVYTLQRYNCYFLCCTILAALTRRIGAWETMFTPGNWAGLMDEVIADLERSSLMPVAERDPADYFATGIFKHLDPHSSTPNKFIVGFIRSKTNIDACAETRDACAGLLWYRHSVGAVYRMWFGDRFDIRKVMEDSLSGGTGPHVPENGPESQLAKLHTLLGKLDMERYDPRCEAGLNYISMQKCQSGEIMSSASRWVQYFMDLLLGTRGLALRAKNNPRLKLHLRLMSFMLASVLTPLLPLVLCLLSILAMRTDPWLNLVISLSGGASWVLRLTFTIPFGTRFQLVEYFVYQYFGIISWAECVAVRDEVAMQKLTELIKYVTEEGARLLFSIQLGSIPQEAGNPSTPAMLPFINYYLGYKTWRAFLEHSVFNRVTKATISRTERNPGMLVTCIAGERKDTSVIEFQKYIQDRIKDHSERVGKLKLAASPLVQDNIEGVIGEIWKLLPPGFGGLYAMPEGSLTPGRHPQGNEDPNIS